MKKQASAQEKHNALWEHGGPSNVLVLTPAGIRALEKYQEMTDRVERLINDCDVSRLRIGRLETLLELTLDFLDGQEDVVDGSYGEPAPNKAMSLANEIREVLGH